MSDREMITANKPFQNTDPLLVYLDTLEQVTEHPTLENIDRLTRQDEVLTSRTVSFPVREYTVDDVECIIGYRSCAVSGGIQLHARLSLYEFGTQEYIEEFDQVWSKPFRPNPDPNFANLKSRRQAARGSIQALGGYMAVSGGFETSDVELAYEMLVDALEEVHDGDEKTFLFGRRRIGKDLANNYYDVKTSRTALNPIPASEAIDNIEAAWDVVGRPYGPLTKAVGRLLNGRL